jgi:hypothetical protein
MVELKTISKEFAINLLSETSFENRLVGVTMSPSAGNTDEHLYSYIELFHFLNSSTYDELTQRGHATMAYIDIDKMLNWIGVTYGDRELAEFMSAEMYACNSLAEKLGTAREIIKQRIDQCKEILDN